MTVKLDALKQDRRKTTEGEWVDCPELGVGVALKVRSPDYGPFKMVPLQYQASLDSVTNAQVIFDRVEYFN